MIYDVNIKCKICANSRIELAKILEYHLETMVDDENFCEVEIVGVD